MARTKPRPNSPVVLLHPFKPNAACKTQAEEGDNGLSAEQPGQPKQLADYVASEFTTTKRDYPEFNWLFDAVIARDPDGVYWVKYWGDEVWQRMPERCSSVAYERVPECYLSADYEYALGHRARKGRKGVQ